MKTIKVPSITITLHQSDYSEVRSKEGWAGTVEDFVKIIEMRVKQAIKSQVGWFTIKVQHGITPEIVVQVPNGTTSDVVRITEEVMRTIKWVGV